MVTVSVTNRKYTSLSPVKVEIKVVRERKHLQIDCQKQMSYIKRMVDAFLSLFVSRCLILNNRMELNASNSSYYLDEDDHNVFDMSLFERNIKFYILLIMVIPSLCCTVFM